MRTRLTAGWSAVIAHDTGDARYVPAVTLDQAIDALVAHPGATVLAGGTDLMVQRNFGLAGPTTYVAVRKVPELHGLRDGWIGAMTSFRTLERADRPALAALARTVGSPQIRNRATVGGNLGTASPAGDLLPFLAAMDATVVLRGVAGERRLSWDAFLLGPKRTARSSDEVVLGVELPDERPATEAFAKVGVRSAMVIATASCCLLRFADGRVRVAFGSVGPTVLRARRAEAFIASEGRPSPAAIAEFGRIAAAEVRPITDHRSTEAYRRHASGVLASRLLERSLT